jgi:hypothetical protein
MSKTIKVIIPAGADAVFYIDGRIIQRDTFHTETSVFTQSEHFIGTAAEVDAKITELSLT